MKSTRGFIHLFLPFCSANHREPSRTTWPAVRKMHHYLNKMSFYYSISMEKAAIIAIRPSITTCNINLSGRLNSNQTHTDTHIHTHKSKTSSMNAQTILNYLNNIAIRKYTAPKTHPIRQYNCNFYELI